MYVSLFMAHNNKYRSMESQNPNVLETLSFTFRVPMSYPRNTVQEPLKFLID
jgi:hypothetical protein